MNDDAGKFIGVGGAAKLTSSAAAGSNEFIKKPGKGWIHSDESIQEGITYTVKVSPFNELRRVFALRFIKFYDFIRIDSIHQND